MSERWEDRHDPEGDRIAARERLDRMQEQADAPPEYPFCRFAERFAAQKGEHCHQGPVTDAQSGENEDWLRARFEEVGIPLTEAFACGLGLGARVAREVVTELTKRDGMSEAQLLAGLQAKFAEVWVDAALTAATYKADR